MQAASAAGPQLRRLEVGRQKAEVRVPALPWLDLEEGVWRRFGKSRPGLSNRFDQGSGGCLSQTVSSTVFLWIVGDWSCSLQNRRYERQAGQEARFRSTCRAVGVGGRGPAGRMDCHCLRDQARRSRWLSPAHWDGAQEEKGRGTVHSDSQCYAF